MKLHILLPPAVLLAAGSLPAHSQCTPENPTQITTGIGDELLDVAFGEGRFLAVGLNGTMIWSEDGQTWNELLLFGGVSPPQDLFDVEYGDGEFVIVGEESVAIQISASDLLPSPATPFASLESVTTPNPSGTKVNLTGVGTNGPSWVAVGWRNIGTGGSPNFENVSFGRNCSGGTCTWIPRTRWDGLTSSDILTGVAVGPRPCKIDPNVNFVTARASGRVDIINPQGFWVDVDGIPGEGQPDSQLSDVDFVGHANGLFIAGGAGDFISTSPDGGYQGISVCPDTSENWTDVSVNNPPQAGRVWSGAGFRQDIRALVGKVATSGTTTAAVIGYTASETDWTPTFTQQLLGIDSYNGIAASTDGWVLVGGDQTTQAVGFKSCNQVLITQIDDHQRVAGSTAVFQFSIDDGTPGPFSYTVSVGGNTLASVGGAFFQNDRVRGDINDDGVVNFVDLGLLRTAFFEASGASNYDGFADLNSDGIVNFVDLGILRQNFFVTFGNATPSQIVSIVEWTPLTTDIGNSLTVSVTASNGSVSGNMEFDVTVTDPAAPTATN